MIHNNRTLLRPDNHVAHSEPPELWSTAEIAEYLRMSRKSVQNRLIHQRGFPRPVRGSRRTMLWVKREVLEYVLDR